MKGGLLNGKVNHWLLKTSFNRFNHFSSTVFENLNMQRSRLLSCLAAFTEVELAIKLW
jgi:hypothetical protein